MGALVVGRVKEVVEEVDESGRFDPRSSILTQCRIFSSCDAAIWPCVGSVLAGPGFSAFIPFFVSSLLGFGLVGKSGLCCILHQLDSTNPLFMCMVSMSYDNVTRRTSWWGWIGMGWC